MRAMALERLGPIGERSAPLSMATVPDPEPGDGQVLIEVRTCGVCHTEIDEIEGRTPPPSLPVILGHQVVGRVAGLGRGVRRYAVGDRVGVAWIHSACGRCRWCRRGDENLCLDFKATGRDVNGGYAELVTVAEDFAHSIPDTFTDAEAAPLLCAGAIGYRSLRLANVKEGDCLGLTGFGASGHLVLQLARFRYPKSAVFVFARSESEREFARQLGAEWAGDTEEDSPQKLDAVIDTTPVWLPIVKALANLAPGGRLVVNAIRKEDVDKDRLLELDYTGHLWMEKEIKSVANVTRKDVSEFLELAAEMGIKPEVREYALEDANRALVELKMRKIRGAKVLRIG
jgi:propanol-preferring alcohol dehydrogenase